MFSNQHRRRPSSIRLGVRSVRLSLFPALRAFVLLEAVPPNRIFQVLRLELPLLVVSVRFLERYGDHVEHIRRLLEDAVHFLERAIAGFWEEEVDHREDEGVAEE